MNDPSLQRRGQPILFLGLLLAGWLLLRIVTWESPWREEPELFGPYLLAESRVPAQALAPEEAAAPSGQDLPAMNSATPLAPPRSLPLEPASDRVVGKPLPELAPAPGYARHFDTHRRAVGHNLLFAAGMASLPMPRAVSQMLERRKASSLRAQHDDAAPTPGPWRFDGWLSLRSGDRLASAAGASFPASYGASQAGAVLSYRLTPAGNNVLHAYLRASWGLVEGGETDVAAGLRARPLRNLPLNLHVEARVSDSATFREIRPAAFVSTGFDNVRLPAGIRARGYAQAGYVHGDFATGFADGKMVAQREVTRFDLGSASVGAGAWGGAQRGAARLDIGPTVSLDLRLGDAPARIEADYRFRIAGNAEPGNGGVLTLSTGF